MESCHERGDYRIEKNGTWQSVDNPENKNMIGVKGTYRTKLKPDDTIHKNKARSVVKGTFHWQKWIMETPLLWRAQNETIRLMLALLHNWDVICLIWM